MCTIPMQPFSRSYLQLCMFIFVVLVVVGRGVGVRKEGRRLPPLPAYTPPPSIFLDLSLHILPWFLAAGEVCLGAVPGHHDCVLVGADPRPVLCLSESGHPHHTTEDTQTHVAARSRRLLIEVMLS